MPLLQLRSHLVPPPQYTENFKVLVWHGSDRETDAAEVQKYDVVLATYAVLESSFRKEHQGFKRKGVTIKDALDAMHKPNKKRVSLDCPLCRMVAV